MHIEIFICIFNSYTLKINYNKTNKLELQIKQYFYSNKGEKDYKVHLNNICSIET